MIQKCKLFFLYFRSSIYSQEVSCDGTTRHNKIYSLKSPLGLQHILNFFNFLKIHSSQVNKLMHSSKCHQESIQIQHPHCKHNNKYIYILVQATIATSNQRYRCDTFSQLYHNKITYLRQGGFHSVVCYKFLG